MGYNFKNALNFKTADSIWTKRNVVFPTQLKKKILENSVRKIETEYENLISCLAHPKEVLETFKR